MAELFNIDFETGDLTQLTSNSGTSTYGVEEDAKKIGTYGLSQVGAGTMDCAKSITDIDEFWVGFHVYLDSNIALDAYGSLFLLTARTDTFQYPNILKIGRGAGAGAPIHWVINDVSSTTNFSLDAWHWVEVHFKCNSADAGGYELWIDGDEAYSNLTLNLSAYEFYNRVRFGDYSNNLAASEFIYFDNIIADDAGRVTEPTDVEYPTPTLRFNVVPNQRIGESFNVGVVSFCKGGIDDVTFTFSGAGYDGVASKVVTEMVLNGDSQTVEYFANITDDEFTSDGLITVTATAHGSLGGERSAELILVHETTTSTIAYVEVDGNDGTGAIDNANLPFATIGAAATAINTANGNCDGGIIIIGIGAHKVDSTLSADAINEWLTIYGESKTLSIIATDSGAYCDPTRLKLQHLTVNIGSAGISYRPFLSYPAYMWFDDINVIGAGRHTAASNPILRGTGQSYYTDVNITDVDYGVYWGELARNVTMTEVGNDAFFNTLCVINCSVDDIDPGDTYWHADGYQASLNGQYENSMLNRIIYGYKVTNAHYQGLFLRTAAGNVDNAFVNVFVEMRSPGRKGSAEGAVVLSAGTIMASDAGSYWDHLIMHGCTFIGAQFGLIESQMTNCSFIGNVFEEFLDSDNAEYTDSSWSLPGNTENNEFLENHYMYSAVTGDNGGTPGASKPHWRAKSPDSDIAASQSIGANVVSYDYTDIGLLGHPLVDSVLLNRVAVSISLLSTDVEGDSRGTTWTTGAFENIAEATVEIVPLSQETTPQIKVMATGIVTSGVCRIKDIVWTGAKTVGDILLVTDIEGNEILKCVAKTTNYTERVHLNYNFNGINIDEFGSGVAYLYRG